MLRVNALRVDARLRAARARLGLAAVLLACVASILPAQTWNDSTTRALVELATRLRARQLADTGLTDYRATAHGYLTFLAQVGQGFSEPPRIVKADELALEVYWHTPNLSKQRIIGRRDTLLLPTDIAYHRDHLGIIQNNFPSIIRLGDGDEVRDVPHPLSPQGLLDYDFAISDSLRIQLPGRVVNVYEVKVRPKDDRRERVIGAVYIDRDGGQVVRMALSFTRAAFKDTQLEDLSIVLENRLVGTRFWLPSRQEIEIRRSATWMDYPVRGIIRGRWEIADYQVNTGLPFVMFAGPEIVQAPPETQQRHPWPTTRVLDALPPDVRAVTDADVRRVQAEARALVRSQALQRTRTLALSARGVSDFVRVNRVEGLAFGGGLTQRLGAGFSIGARVRYGVDDEMLKPYGQLDWQNGGGFGVRLFGGREFRDLGDVAERSRLTNSIASQEFGSDNTDPYGVTGMGLSLQLARSDATSWRLEGSVDHVFPLSVHAQPTNGHYEGLIDVPDLRFGRVALRAERPTSLSLFATELRSVVELRSIFRNAQANLLCTAPLALPCSEVATLRGSIDADLERPFGEHRLVLHTVAAAVGAKDDLLPPQELVYFGGPVTGPGYDFHRFVGRAGVSQRVEWRMPVPFVSLSLGRFGTTPASAKLAPYAHVVVIGGDIAGITRGGVPVPSGPTAGYPSVGVGLLTFFELLRLDVARGLRGGRWSFAIDVTGEFWGVL